MELNPPKTPDKTPKPNCHNRFSLINNFMPIRPFKDTMTIAIPIETVSSPFGYLDRKSDVKKMLIMIAIANIQ